MTAPLARTDTRQGRAGDIATTPLFDDSFVVSQLVDDLSYHADLTGGQPGNEPASMPAYEAARSRVGTQSAPV